MAERIKRTDISEDDVFGGIKKSAEEALNELQLFDKTVKSIADTFENTLNKSTKINVENIEKLNKAVKDSVVVTKEKEKADQQRVTIEKEYNKLLAEEARLTARNTNEYKEQAVTNAKVKEQQREELLVLKAKGNAYKELSVKTRQLKNESKQLGAELLVLKSSGKASHEEIAKLEAQYRQVTAQAQRYDAQLKELDRTTGDNFRNVGNYGQAIGNLKQKILGYVGAFAGFQLLRSAGKTVVEFDEKLADISKTTGLTIEQAKKLSTELLKIDTRTSVTGLQELASAAGRLGIEGEQNIVGFVRAADMAFVALGDDLEGTAEEIATNLGKVADQFGLIDEYGQEGGITRVGSVFNELASSSKADAGSIQDFTNRLAGVGAQAGLTLAEVASLGAMFDDAGQSIEVASTTMSTLLPELAKDTAGFAKVAGVTEDAFKTMLAESPMKALKAVAEGAKSSEKGLLGLNATLQKYGISSARASSIVGVLSGNIDKLNKFEEIANKQIKENTSLANENQTKQATLGATIERLKKSWDAWLISMSNSTSATAGLNSMLGFLANNLSIVLTWVGRVVIAFTSWKLAMKAMAFGEQIKNLRAVNKALAENATVSDEAGKSAKGFGSALKSIGFGIAITLLFEMAKAFYDVASGAKAARVEAARLEKTTAKGTELAQSRIDNAKQEYEERNKLLKMQIKDQTLLNKKLAESKAIYEQEMKNQIKWANQRGATYKKELAQIEALVKASKDTSRSQNERTKALLEANKLARELGEKYGIKGNKTNILGINVGGNDALNFEGAMGQLNANIAAINSSIKLYNSELDTSVDVTSDYGDEVDNLNTKMANLNTTAKDTTNAVEKQFKAIDDIDALLDGGKSLEQIEDEEISAENDLIQRRLDERLTIIKKQLLMEETTQEDAIFAQHAMELEALNEQKRILELYGRDTFAIDQQILDKRLEMKELYGDKEVEATEKNTEHLNEIYQSASNVVSSFTDFFLTQSDRRIEALQREVEAQQELRNRLQGMAEAGNIDAQQSIKATIEAQRESEKEQMKIEKKKQQIQLISQGLQSYISALENGSTPTKALLETTLTTGALMSFLSGLKGFYTGTDNAPEGWAWTQEKGAEMITDKQGKIKTLGTGEGAKLTYLQRGDKVVNAKQTTDYLNALTQYKATTLNSDVVGNSYDVMTINKLERIEKAIKAQPHSTTDWQNITSGLVAITSSTSKGKDRIVNRHYIKR